jgi:hypothetical protein
MNAENYLANFDVFALKVPPLDPYENLDDYESRTGDNTYSSFKNSIDEDEDDIVDVLVNQQHNDYEKIVERIKELTWEADDGERALQLCKYHLILRGEPFQRN